MTSCFPCQQRYRALTQYLNRGKTLLDMINQDNLQQIATMNQLRRAALANFEAAVCAHVAEEAHNTRAILEEIEQVDSAISQRCEAEMHHCSNALLRARREHGRLTKFQSQTGSPSGSEISVAT